MCKVSVIIPVYNAEKYLENVFNSLLNQSIGFENLQIIFVDNASSDDSLSYLNGLNLPITIVENCENVSFSKGNNDAAKIANVIFLKFFILYLRLFYTKKL